MFLSELRIENFRMFGEEADALVLPLREGLTALVGENDSGKTAVVDAEDSLSSWFKIRGQVIAPHVPDVPAAHVGNRKTLFTRRCLRGSWNSPGFMPSGCCRRAYGIPPEVWNRLGTKVLTKFRSGSDLKVGVDFSVTVGADVAGNLASELRQILDDLGLSDKIQVRNS